MNDYRSASTSNLRSSSLAASNLENDGEGGRGQNVFMTPHPPPRSLASSQRSFAGQVFPQSPPHPRSLSASSIRSMGNYGTPTSSASDMPTQGGFFSTETPLIYHGGGEGSSPQYSNMPSDQVQSTQTENVTAGPSKQSGVGAKVSCLECRASKVKCLPSKTGTQGQLGQDNVKCARCERMDKECVFEKHKRGRKPDAVKYGRLEKQLETILQELRHDKGQGAEGRSSADMGILGDDTEEAGPESPARKRLRTQTVELLSDWAAQERISAAKRDTHSGAKSMPRQSSGASRKNQAGVGEDLPDSGLPSLSNPFKLLAQISATDEGDDDEDSDDSPEHSGQPPQSSATTDASRMDSSRRRHNRQFDREPGGPSGPSSPKSRVFGRFQPQDRLGIYDSKHDIDAKLDPLALPSITLAGAQRLWSIFLDKLTKPFVLLDPKLYSFDYIRSRSHLLLSVGLSLTARYIPATPDLPTDKIAERMDKHIFEVVVPEVLAKGYRSIHIAKAFMMLAAYNNHAYPLHEDRSFDYLTTAFSMCVALDLNRRMLSFQADPTDEMSQRKMRERERTYLSAWAYYFSICLHHGRRCPLSISDPMVMAAKDWHHSPWALPEDAGLVSTLQLRQLLARNCDYWSQHVATQMPTPKNAYNGGDPPDEACRMLLEFHRRSITEDLDAWHAAWVMPTSAANAKETESDERPFRLRSAACYHAYASLILHSLPLRPGTEKEPCLRIFREKAHQSAVSVLGFFLALPAEHVIWIHNSLSVTLGFASVYALRTPDPGIQVVNMVKEVIERMRFAGNVTPHRRSFGAELASFLKKVVKLHELRGTVGNARPRRSSSRTGRSTGRLADEPPQIQSRQGLGGTQLAGQAVRAVAPPASSGDQAYDPAGTSTSFRSPSQGHLYASSGYTPAPTGLAGFSMDLGPYTGGDPFDGSWATTGNQQQAGSVSSLTPSDLWDPTSASSPSALMDALMMTHPLGLTFTSLLGPDTDPWGGAPGMGGVASAGGLAGSTAIADWSFFLPGPSASVQAQSAQSHQQFSHQQTAASPSVAASHTQLNTDRGQQQQSPLQPAFAPIDSQRDSRSKVQQSHRENTG